VALKLLDQLGERLGWALTAVAGGLDPEIFLVGGGLSNAGSILLERIQRGYRKYAFHAFRETEFALAELGNDAGIFGCVRMVLE
jgi:glucokinase